MEDSSPRMTAAHALAREIEAEQTMFSSDARAVADLAKHIASSPSATRVGGDLSSLSQRVTELVRRAAKIKASGEALELMKAEMPGDNHPMDA